MSHTISLPSEALKKKFLNITRILAYSLIGYPNQMKDLDFQDLQHILRYLEILSNQEDLIENQTKKIIQLGGSASFVFCNLRDHKRLNCKAF